MGKTFSRIWQNRQVTTGKGPVEGPMASSASLALSYESTIFDLFFHWLWFGFFADVASYFILTIHAVQ